MAIIDKTLNYCKLLKFTSGSVLIQELFERLSGAVVPSVKCPVKKALYKVRNLTLSDIKIAPRMAIPDANFKFKLLVSNGTEAFFVVDADGKLCSKKPKYL